MSRKCDERTHGHAQSLQFLRASEIRQVDDETSGDDIGAELAQQFHRAFRRAARGYEIVDQNDPFVRGDGVLVHLHLVEAVFQRIGDRYGRVRKLALLSDGNKTRGKLMRDGAAQNETARLDSHDLVDLGAGPPSRVVMSRNKMPGFG
jgi:hypothetical protein